MTKAATIHLRTDPVLAELINQIGPIHHRPRRLSPFQSLVHAVIHQQLSGTAAGTILGRFIGLFGDGKFPEPEDTLRVPVETLRSAGLSRAKAAYIHGIAERAIAGDVPSLRECDLMSDEEILARLTGIKGIGRWTGEMLLIFNLGRPDVLPVHDLGVRRGFQISHRKHTMPEPERLACHGRRWAPHRTMAALYLWRAADFLRDGEW
jgi:DNA-3-methyladenine glycosylase II